MRYFFGWCLYLSYTINPWSTYIYRMLRTNKNETRQKKRNNIKLYECVRTFFGLDICCSFSLFFSFSLLKDFEWKICEEFVFMKFATVFIHIVYVCWLSYKFLVSFRFEREKKRCTNRIVCFFLASIAAFIFNILDWFFSIGMFVRFRSLVRSLVCTFASFYYIYFPLCWVCRFFLRCRIQILK